LKETGYITNEEVFHLKTLPKRLFVLGAGAIGIELGQAAPPSDKKSFTGSIMSKAVRPRG